MIVHKFIESVMEEIVGSVSVIRTIGLHLKLEKILKLITG